MTDRIIALVDMDCFYVQVEERDNPEIKGKPAAVVQYNAWKGGAIIAVNYEARASGVKRGMRGTDAKSLCPELILVKVPVLREKADLTKYRNAGKEVIMVLCDFADCVERASIDEAYIDLTSAIGMKVKSIIDDNDTDDDNSIGISLSDLPSTWVVGYDDGENGQDSRTIGVQKWLSECKIKLKDCKDSDELWEDHLKLIIAASICEKMRSAVLQKTGFKCSAGISHNKMLSKISCGIHKPNQQTILPFNSVPLLWESMPLVKIRNLGGKLGGTLMEDFKCMTMADLSKLALTELKGRFDDKTANWIHSLGEGIDNEAVVSRQLAKSVGCGKNFNGRDGLDTREKVKKWVQILSSELSTRLEEDRTTNKRQARTLTLGAKLDDGSFISKSHPLYSNDEQRISQTVMKLLQHMNTTGKGERWSPTLRNLSLSAGKFDDCFSSHSGDIQAMFKKANENNSIRSNMHLNNVIPHVESKIKQTRKEDSASQSFFKKFMKNNGISLHSNVKSIGNNEISSVNSNEKCIKNIEIPLYNENKDISKLDSTEEFIKNGEISESMKNEKIPIIDSTEKNKISEIDSNENIIKVNGTIIDNPTEEIPNNETFTVNSTEKCISNDIPKVEATNEGKSNLDLLIQCMDDDSNSSNKSVKSTESIQRNLNNLTSTDLCESQDLFTTPYNGPCTKPSTSTYNNNIELNGSSSNLNGETSSKSVAAMYVDHYEINYSEETCQVSFEELFPDENQIDESIVPHLPLHLRIKAREVLNKNLELRNAGGPSSQYPMTRNGMSKGISDAWFEDACSNSLMSKLEDIDSNLDVLRENNHQFNNIDNVKRFNTIVTCEECGKTMPRFNLTEHLDYHYAVNVRKEQFLEAKKEITLTGSGKGVGKKRKGKGKKSPENISKHPKIEDYFKNR